MLLHIVAPALSATVLALACFASSALAHCSGFSKKSCAELCFGYWSSHSEVGLLSPSLVLHWYPYRLKLYGGRIFSAAVSGFVLPRIRRSGAEK